MANEELSEHPQLLQLEAAALADVEQYGACSLADKARIQKLSVGIQGKLSQIRALTRDLELLVEEVDSDEEQQQVEALLAQHKGEYARIQAAFKQAALAQCTSALRSAAKERRELLSGADAMAHQRKLQTEADSVALAEDVTGGLRRTRQVLAEELEHTGATLAAMEASHAQLTRTRDEYQGQHGRLKRSKGLLGNLNWQAKSETYMLWLGLGLFVLVCTYIFQKRAVHFIPDRLRPPSLFKATGLIGRSSRPVPVPAPTGRLHPHALPPKGHVPAEQRKVWEEEVEKAAYVPPVPTPGPEGHCAAAVEMEEPQYEPYRPLEEEELEPDGSTVYEPAAAVAGEQQLLEEEQAAMQEGAQAEGPKVEQQGTQPEEQMQPEEQAEQAQEHLPEEAVRQQPPEARADPEPAAAAVAEQHAVIKEPATTMPEEQPAEPQQKPSESKVAAKAEGSGVPVQPSAPEQQADEAAAGMETQQEPAQQQDPVPTQQQQPAARDTAIQPQDEGSSAEPELLDPVPQPTTAADSGPPQVQAEAAVQENHEAAVWPKKSSEPHTEPGSPAHAQMHMARQQAAASAEAQGQEDMQPHDGTGGESRIINDPQGRRIVVDHVEDFVTDPQQQQVAEEHQAAVDLAKHPAEPAKPALAAEDGPVHNEL